ncbi:Sec-independent protein translocase TatA [Cereibacter sphaeroides]|uniref:twin-arginine translocase TatA/TatE family subunit n=1 Tax=Cereibacter sphaeroides TaxID=1063 RepID=UPI000F522338|nr:twin-arginine translocase TatA/TatE family subunit [Cereibacter sphaeroides]AZB57005.1 Sec-independent protein translocase TatA [Cereibacter sphaeroides]AZB61256.1 Sec-independent protein translocase TatA [Cereibacter sphaeroides]
MLNNIGLPGLLVIAAAIIVLFGKGKVSSMMGELGRGISAFKQGLQDPPVEPAAAEPPREIKDA